MFGGRPVRLRLSGDRLAALLPRAIAHLRVPDPLPAADELRIELWDEAETGVGCAGCCRWSDVEAMGRTSASPDGRYLLVRRALTRTVVDRVAQHIVGWVADARLLTQYEVGRPLQSELLLWHRDRGFQAVHAGLVARGDDGLLLGGPGGSGKSTAALTCMLAGMAYLADDYVAIDESDEAVTGHSVYCSTHVEPAHLERFPALRPHAIPGRLAREDKSLVVLADLPDGVFARSARVRALAFPRVVDADTTRYRPISRTQALVRLAPSSLLLLPYPDAMGPGFENMATLVRRLPVYWLELGRDLDSIPRAVSALLGEVSP